ncbi:MAG: ArnT family glycosyltransferase [Candidatus Binatia bacterium]
MSEWQRTQQTVVGLFLLCFLLYFWELGNIPFYNYEESKEALVVWEMVNGGGWILPKRNGTELPLKPPLFHWCGALIGIVSGKVNEFAVRSPSAISATAAVLLTFFFARRLWHWRVGLFSALILATSPEWLRWSVYARSDLILSFFLTAAAFSFFCFWRERATQPYMLTLFYVSIGLATLAKGPLGLVLPGIIVLTFLYVAKDLDFLKRMHLSKGAGIVFGIAISWYLAAWWLGGWEFFHRQILDENVFRFFESEHGGPSRDHAFYYYIPTLFVGMLPWSLFFPLVGYFLYKSRPLESKLVYLVIWFLGGFLFFSLASGKRGNYLLPLYPAIALLLGVWWQELCDGSFRFSPLVKQIVRGLALLLCFVLTVMVGVLLAHGMGADLEHLVSPFLHPRDLRNLPLVADSIQRQFPVVCVWLLMIAMALGWYFWGLRRDQWMYVFAALTVATSSSLYFTKALFHPLLAQERTYKPFMLGVRSTVKNFPLYFYNEAYDYGAIFYAARHIPVYKGDLSDFPLDSDGSPSYLLVREEDWPARFAESDLRFEHLVESEGLGPDKKHRLALIAVLPPLPHDNVASANGVYKKNVPLPGEGKDSEPIPPQAPAPPQALGTDSPPH